MTEQKITMTMEQVEQEMEEYWIVDWRKRTVEIYELDYEGEIPKYYLLKTITEENKDGRGQGGRS